jgi:signal transduction histidine kinase/ligand-binding sensor domain-containing protein/DNA-binding response OmpR family regulator
MIRKISTILFFLIIYNAASVSQSSLYKSFFNINPGVSSPVVSSIFQDNKGMIWVGTNKGLLNYDGYRFHSKFTVGKKHNTQIHCALQVDKHLYLGADNGVLIYNIEKDRYENDSVVFPSNVRSLHLHKNNLWIGTLDDFYCYNLEDKILTHFDRDRYRNIPHQAIYTIESINDDKIMIGTYDGLCIYSYSDDNIVQIGLPKLGNNNNRFVNCLYNDSVNNTMWVGMEGGLLKYSTIDESIHIVSQLNDQSVKTMTCDRDSNLVIGTDNGLYIYNPSDYKISHILHDSRDQSSLTNNIIWSVFKDRDQNIWLGTDYGISLARHNNPLIYTGLSELTNSGEGNQIYSIFKDSNGFYWLGGTHGLIRTQQYDSGWANARWYNTDNRNYPLPHGRIRHIYEDRDKNLWIATDASINRYNPNRQQFEKYLISDSTGKYNSNWAYGIYEDNDHNLWIATCLGGVFVVDKNKLIGSKTNNYIADYVFTEKQLTSTFVTQLTSDNQGNIWILSHDKTISKISISTKAVDIVFANDSTNSLAPTFLTSDNDGIVWIGVKGGVLRVDPATSNKELIKFNGFPNAETLSMASTESDIWVSATDGLWLIDRKTRNPKRVILTTRRFSSMFYDRDNSRMLLGDVNGFATIPSDISDFKQGSNPVFASSITINGKQEPLSEGNISYISKLNLNHKENNITLEITDLPYSLDEKSTFVYSLHPIDNTWTVLEAASNRIAYSNLAPGEYNLTVSKLDAQNQPSEQKYNLQIIISSPWYLTSIAKLIYVIIISLLIIWIINFIIVKNRLKNERLEKSRIKEQLKHKMEFMSNLSHEIKTPLTLIITPLGRLLRNTSNPGDKQQLELIQSNANKINTLIHTMLDFDKIDSNNTLLIRSDIELVSFLKNIHSHFEKSHVDKILDFSFESAVNELYVRMDRVKLDSIFNNLLSNAVKYTNAGGKVTTKIEINNQSKQLIISIKDTGIGIPSKEIPYVHQRFYQSSLTVENKESTGIGLYIAKTYTELLGGELIIESIQAKGTTVYVIFPISAVSDNSYVDEQSENEHNTISKSLVLIADDDMEIIELLKTILTPTYRVVTALDGREALKIALKHTPDLIISDVKMPEMNGFELSRELRKVASLSSTPIILLTGQSDKNTELLGIQTNTDAFIVKPFEPEILLSRIEQLLKRKKSVEKSVRIDMISTPEDTIVTSNDEKFLKDITRIIEDNMSDSEFNVLILSEKSGINSKQIYRRIKQITGKTPVDYIRSIRIKKAAMLLKQRKFTSSEVMYLVGFSNHSYFAKCFKAEFNVTPSQYMGE